MFTKHFYCKQRVCRVTSLIFAAWSKYSPVARLVGRSVCGNNDDDNDYSRYKSPESCIIWRYFRITTVAMHRIDSFHGHFSLNLLSLDLMVQHHWMDNSVSWNILRFLVFTCVNEKVSAFSNRNQCMNNSFLALYFCRESSTVCIIIVWQIAAHFAKHLLSDSE